MYNQILMIKIICKTKVKKIIENACINLSLIFILDLPLAPIVFVVSTTENSIKIQWRSADTKSAISGNVETVYK